MTSASAYKRGVKTALSENFSSVEFDCHCRCCKRTLIHGELISGLEAIRALLSCPITINSGYRCMNHQLELARRGFETAVGISSHEAGAAADLATGRHSGIELEKAARKAGFRAVGVSGNWIHVDLRSDRDRSWLYVKR
jgi:uncharacterized protein YcbK (DUF882 family)